MGTGGQTRLPFLGRNTFRYGNLYNVDLRISRRISFAERKNMEFLAEAFNLFNHQIVTDRSDSYYSIYTDRQQPLPRRLQIHSRVQLQLQHPNGGRQHHLPRARDPTGCASPLLTRHWRNWRRDLRRQFFARLSREAAHCVSQ
jgi:hypothetical protein